MRSSQEVEGRSRPMSATLTVSSVLRPISLMMLMNAPHSSPRAPPLGSCLGSRSTGARTRRRSSEVVWYANTFRLFPLCPVVLVHTFLPGNNTYISISIPPAARSRAWAQSSSLSEHARGRVNVQVAKGSVESTHKLNRHTRYPRWEIHKNCEQIH